MPSILDIPDAVAVLWAELPNGFAGGGPGLALAILGIGGWLRWMFVAVRRALDD